MDLRRLSCFVAVYEERNMTAAAQRCFVSQPALSASIKQLEQELATPLFQRHKRGVDLTDEAHQLYRQIIESCHGCGSAITPQIRHAKTVKRAMTTAFKGMGILLPICQLRS